MSTIIGAGTANGICTSYIQCFDIAAFDLLLNTYHADVQSLKCVNSDINKSICMEEIKSVYWIRRILNLLGAEDTDLNSFPVVDYKRVHSDLTRDKTFYTNIVDNNINAIKVLLYCNPLSEIDLGHLVVMTAGHGHIDMIQCVFEHIRKLGIYIDTAHFAEIVSMYIRSGNMEYVELMVNAPIIAVSKHNLQFAALKDMTTLGVWDEIGGVLLNAMTLKDKEFTELVDLAELFGNQVSLAALNAYRPDKIVSI